MHWATLLLSSVASTLTNCPFVVCHQSSALSAALQGCIMSGWPEPADVRHQWAPASLCHSKTGLLPPATDHVSPLMLDQKGGMATVSTSGRPSVVMRKRR